MVTKAIIAKIELGIITTEGLMLPSGDYAVAVSQVANIFSLPKNHATRDVKRLLCKDSPLPKVASELNSKPVNIIFLNDFKRIIRSLDKQGHPVAEALADALLEEGIERRFARAFNQKVEEEEYDERLKLRMKRLLARHDWTDVLMNRHVDLNGVKPEPQDYKRWTVTVNQKLFGQPHFCRNRDNMTPEQQQTIYDFERMAKRRAEQYPTITADELVIKALDTF